MSLLIAVSHHSSRLTLGRVKCCPRTPDPLPVKLLEALDGIESLRHSEFSEDTQAPQLPVIVGHCSISNSYGEARPTDKNSLGTPLPDDVVKGLVSVLSTSVSTLLEKHIIRQPLKHRFDGFTRKLWQGIPVWVLWRVLLGRAPGSTVVVDLVAVLPDRPNGLLHSFDIT